MDIVALYDAKNRLSEICNQVSESGQPCVISRRGQPLVKLVPIEPEDSKESVWDTVEEAQARHGQLKEDFELPERSGEPSGNPTWLL